MNDPQRVLQTYFGHAKFRNSQAEVIDHVLRGNHAMVVMPTGMGKSLCYQIPALVQQDRLTLVLSPLVALMKDQVDGLVRRGIDAAYINSSLDRQTRLTRYSEVAAGRYQLLYVTPERFRKSEFRDIIAARPIGLLAIDEAHCVSQWGHDFRPDYSRIQEIREWVGHPTTVALTATATAECRSDIYRVLGIPAQDIRLFHEGIDRPNLALQVCPVRDEDEKLTKVTQLLASQQYPGGSVIIYFSLIKTLQRFSDQLFAGGFDHVCYHGDLGRKERRRIQDDFMAGQADVVLATNAFGMGVDKPDIRMVIHAETPGSIESYYQEIGRAGRDNRPSLCCWLYDQNDLMTQMQFIDWSNPDADFYGRVYTLLTEHNESCRAFGLQWVNQRLQKVSRHDHRLDTVISMLDRHGVIVGPREPECFQVLTELPSGFRDNDLLNQKKRRDQQRLYAMVRYAGHTNDRKAFLGDYFLGPSSQDFDDA